MARTQLGNSIGVAARGQEAPAIALVTGNGGATFVTVAIADGRKFCVDGVTLYDFVTVATGVVKAAARLIVVLQQVGGSLFIQYGGADAPTLGVGDGVYAAGEWAVNGPSNLNGGSREMRGLRTYGSYDSIRSMRDRLQALNSSYYTTARLDGLTSNDLVYALRLAEAPGSI